MFRLITVLCGISLAFASSPDENLGDSSLFEGDVKLSPEQQFAIEHHLDLASASSFGASKWNRWKDKTVPYTVDASLENYPSAKRVIESATKEWSEKTCIKFKPRTNEPHYIEFFKGSGCWSYVGMNGGRQQISLAGGCWRHGTVVHEIGHALGFWHEQSRPDRDDYVTIMWENIHDASKHNFNKYSNSRVDSLGVPYDYGSIMHYGKRYFSINGQDTIVPKKPETFIGQRSHLSDLDVKQMRLMYKCDEGTTQPPTPPKPDTPAPPRPTTSRPTPPYRTTQPPTPPKPDTPAPPRPTTPYRTTQPPTPPKPDTPAPPRPTTPYRSTQPPTASSRPTTLTPTSANGLTVHLRSEGCNDPHLKKVPYCGLAYIFVNGKDYSKHGRGHNVVLIDHQTGLVEGQYSYDTHGKRADAKRLVADINKWADAKERKIVLIAVQDEGSSSFRFMEKKSLQRIGASHLVHVFHRQSYALIGYTGPERPSWIIDKKSTKGRGPTLISAVIPNYLPTPPPRPTTRPRTTLGPRPPGVNVHLRSEGCDDPHKQTTPYCGLAYIFVNGKDYSKHGRGHNVVLIDHQTGLVEGQYSYDTHGKRADVQRLLADIHKWADAKERKIVLIAIQDEGSSAFRFGERRHLARIGASLNVYAYHRQSYGLIGYTGPERPSWITDKKSGKGKGPTLISAFIPLYVPTTPPRPRPTGPVTTGPVTTRPPVGPCGVSGARSRVIGGTNAAPGAWPWQIALLRSGRFSCGGSLVAADWVVTAAHCIGRGISPSSYTILLGAHDRYKPQSHEQRIKAKKVIVHPSYGRPRLSSDIALIQLERPATMSSRVSTVCLPDQNYAVPLSAECYITGWGKIKHPGSSHNVLQQAKLPPIDQEDCKSKLALSPNGASLTITEVMLCAGVKDTILSGCHGDSGGPYVCRDSSNRFVLHGAVSWGSPRCDAAERYSVFARVAKFRNWIDQEMRNA